MKKSKKWSLPVIETLIVKRKTLILIGQNEKMRLKLFS